MRDTPDVSTLTQVDPADALGLLSAMFEAPGLIAGVLEDIGDDYRYILANRNNCDFYRLPENGLTGLTGRDLGMTLEHIADRLDLMRRCHAAGAAETLELPFASPTGSSSWFVATFAPMSAPPGSPPRSSYVVIDVTARKAAELQNSEQRERLSLAIAATRLGLWEFDLRTETLTWDERTREILGVAPDAPVAFESYFASLHPADSAPLEAEYHAAIGGANGGEFLREHRIIAQDGKTRWVEGAGRVVFEDGQPAKVLGTVRDIDARMRGRERQGLLLAELNHRVKNNLAMVQALAGHTLRSHPEPAVFARVFEARLKSLASAHDLLSINTWQTAEVAAVITKALEAFPTSAFVLEGPLTGVKVRPDLAVSIALLIHELATNSAKYGALTSPAGRIAVAWGLSDEGMRLTWTESGGPTIAPPTRAGLGTRLIRRSMQSIGGESELIYDPSGVRARFTAPLTAGVQGGGE